MTKPPFPKAAPLRPPADALARIETVGGLIAPDDPGLQPWFERYRRQHAERLGADLALLVHHAPADARVLEYGSVPLLLTAAATELGYRVSGLDLAPQRFSRSIATLGLDVRRCDVESEPVPFPDEAFDVVLFNELFEHLRIDLIHTLREAHRVLKPGGVLLLSTPNLRSFRGLRKLLFEHRGHTVADGVYEQWAKLQRLGHVGHVREYTAQEVHEVLERIGFEVRGTSFRGGHGAGWVGVAERLVPSLRPSMVVLAARRARQPSRGGG